MAYVLLVWLACHFLGDFPWQGDYLAQLKGSSWQHLFYHCACYTGVFVLFAHPSLLALGIIFASHFVIDALSARYKIIKWLWLDQLLHVLVIFVLLGVHVAVSI